MDDFDFDSEIRKATVFLVGLILGYLMVSYAIDLAYILHAVKMELRVRRLNLLLYQRVLILRDRKAPVETGADSAKDVATSLPA